MIGDLVVIALQTGCGRKDDLPVKRLSECLTEADEVHGEFSALAGECAGVRFSVHSFWC